MTVSTTRKTRRHFFKCSECRQPWAIDIPGKPCTGRFACSAKGEQYYYPDTDTLRACYDRPCPQCSATRRQRYMGEVGPKRGRLVRQENRTPCDARCTNARGPNCECFCGGVNHGTHRLVTVLADQGRLPFAAVVVKGGAA